MLLANDAGWIPVDGHTLATRYEGVYALGDVAAIPLPGRFQSETPLVLPKAGVFAHKQAEVLANNLAVEITGQVRRSRLMASAAASSNWATAAPATVRAISTIPRLRPAAGIGSKCYWRSIGSGAGSSPSRVTYMLLATRFYLDRVQPAVLPIKGRIIEKCPEVDSLHKFF
jgi:NADH dehydrogenase FAD-containing subunit